MQNNKIILHSSHLLSSKQRALHFNTGHLTSGVTDVVDPIIALIFIALTFPC